MLVKWATFLSLMTIATLNAILLVAASSNGQVLANSASFSLLVNVMYIALIGSSLLLGYLNLKKTKKAWAFLFWANIFIVFIPTILSIAGLLKVPSVFLIFLIFLDLYWLNQYLVYTVGAYGLPNPSIRWDAGRPP